MPGPIGRIWARLTSPSARWSVLTLLLAGIAIGFAAVVGTQVMVYATGTDQFCGTACHSMQWVAKEHKQSVHVVNRTGVKAGCHDCHIPHDYPYILFYKARAGIKDAIGEMRGVISTEEKFKKERLRMAKHVWEEYQGNNSQACRTCHQFSKEVIAKQREEVRPIHEAVLGGQGTCIDCHKGVAHKAPDE
jgi:nitrate/TMAO reductase-like tetraheme cytochrome c subunit